MYIFTFALERLGPLLVECKCIGRAERRVDTVQTRLSIFPGIRSGLRFLAAFIIAERITSRQTLQASPACVFSLISRYRALPFALLLALVHLGATIAHACRYSASVIGCRVK